MDGPPEYEVESVTRARVYGKRGKKITWKYYVKWKGYDWDESTWEPTDSFQGGSEHILETFWERIDTGGRDISDATAFKKGEELFISGPPVKKGLKRKAKLAKAEVPPPEVVPNPNGASVSAPPLSTRKRQHIQITIEDEWVHTKPKRRVSTGVLKDEGVSTRSPKRRRVSSSGSRKSAQKRHPSVGDSQLDADGETDPDVVEVEDELMQVSAEDAEEGTDARNTSIASGSANEPRRIAFDDLEHFYSGNPIDIDQNTDEHLSPRKPEARMRLQSPPSAVALASDHAIPEFQVPASPALSSLDPLFDSPSHFSDKVPEIPRDPVPHHRARAANPRVKLIDTTTPDTMNQQSRITTKARLMTVHIDPTSFTSGPSRNTAKRGGKPGPGRSSGLIAKNRSSLFTPTKGALKTVKGQFTSIATEYDQPDESEDVAVDEDHQATSDSYPGLPPTGDELLKLAGLQTDPQMFPDYEDDFTTQPQEAEIQGSTNSTSTPAKEELPNQPSLGPTEACGANVDVYVANASPSVCGAGQQASTPVIDDPSSSVAIPPVDEAVKKNIELAKEQLFPSTQTSFNSFSTTQSSFQTTIFGPLYQGSMASSASVAPNESSTVFKVILSDSVEFPLALKDCNEIKARISDIQIGSSSGSKVAVFYSPEDALAMVSALKSDGTARVVLDPSAKETQQERFSMFLQRFESSQTLIAPVGKDVSVLYSSENADIAEKLGAPVHIRGLSNTLLISYASIENQLAYAAAAMRATAV